LAKTGKDTSSGEIPENVELKLLQKLVKQRNESAEVYKSQNRAELADEELFQAGIIEGYLPEQMSNDEIKAIIERIVSETGASGMKEMGKVMGMASKQLAGKADNKTISAIAKELLMN